MNKNYKFFYFSWVCQPVIVIYGGKHHNKKGNYYYREGSYYLEGGNY